MRMAKGLFTKAKKAAIKMQNFVKAINSKKLII
jgi:hypothetical protein